MATSTPTAASGKEALEKALPRVVSGFSSLSNAISATVRFAEAIIFSRFSPLPVIFYIMAPIFVFVETLIKVLVFLPYDIFISLMDTFYPIYVFCGVALITGGIIGLVGRIISRLVVGFLEKEHVYDEMRIPGKRKGKAKM